MSASLKNSAWMMPNMGAMKSAGYDPAAAMWIMHIWQEVSEPGNVSPDLYTGLVARLGDLLLQAKTLPEVGNAITLFRQSSFPDAAQPLEFSDAVPQMRAIGYRACRLLNPHNFNEISNLLGSQFRLWGDVREMSQPTNAPRAAETYDAAPSAVTEQAAALMAAAGLDIDSFLFHGQSALRMGTPSRYDHKTRSLVIPPDGAGAALAWFEALDWQLYESLLPGCEVEGPLTHAIDQGVDGGGHPVIAAMRELMDVMRSKAESGDTLMLIAQQRLMQARKTFDAVLAEIALNAAATYGRHRAEPLAHDILAIANDYLAVAATRSPQEVGERVAAAWQATFGEPISGYNRTLAEAPAQLLHRAAAHVAKIKDGQVRFAIAKTGYLARSGRMDEVSRRTHWATPGSLAARAFMAWGEDMTNDVRYTTGPAFPDGEERVTINASLTALMQRVAMHLDPKAAERKARRGLVAA